MIGSFFINCWAALFAFSIYFLSTFRDGVPSKVIIGSFIAAAIIFVIMYPFRLLLGYILYTPQDQDILEEFGDTSDVSEEKNVVENPSNIDTKNSSETPEEIAKVVRNMMNEDDAISTN